MWRTWVSVYDFEFPPKFPTSFHKSARLGDLRSDFDPSVTYEGDNNMIILQATNYLLALLKERQKSEGYYFELKLNDCFWGFKIIFRQQTDFIATENCRLHRTRINEKSEG